MGLAVNETQSFPLHQSGSPKKNKKALSIATTGPLMNLENQKFRRFS
jgi:hypothetical protein